MATFIRSCRVLFLVAALSLVSVLGFAQTTVAGARTVVVLPFDNLSNAPGLQWISEAFPEVIGQRLSSPSLYVISREDRIYAFDRLGIPTTVHPSRATLYRIAEQMDADFVILGEYSFDGRTFSSQSQVLDMKNLRLSDPVKSSGPLTDLIDIQRTLAWELVRTIHPGLTLSREEFLRNAAPVRLDAFENYIRGVLAGTRQEKVKYFRETLRLNPQYTLAWLQLGRTYFAGREWEQAATALAKIPKNDSAASEANFLLGLSNYYLGQFDKAEAAFKVTESRLPLTEVYNNLGVVLSRRGNKKNAVDYFQRAVQADPNDADYHFNLGVALYRNGDVAGAMRQLRESLAKRPADAESKQFLDQISANAAAPANKPDPAAAQAAASTTTSSPRVPLERIKRNYDETSYRQLALEVQNAMEQSLAKADPHTHASFHVDRGRELMAQGFALEAERQFHEAVQIDPTNAAAHAGLAHVAEINGDAATARSEANTSLRLQQNADAYLVLARLDLKDNKLDSAESLADRALKLEPANASATALKKTIAAQRSGTATNQP